MARGRVMIPVADGSLVYLLPELVDRQQQLFSPLRR